MGEPIQRIIKFVTTQHIIDGRPLEQGFPMRAWTCEVLMDDAQGNEVTPPFIDKVIFKLHPTFPNPNKTIKRPPFKIAEEGWGEFEMHIVLHYTDGGGSQTIPHDLNFQTERYEKPHTLTFKNPKPNLLRALQASGSVPAGYNAAGTNGAGAGAPAGATKRAADGGDKKSKKPKNRPVDMEKLADALQKLNEDDLLQIVQMVNDQKTDDMYVKNDIEGMFLFSKMMNTS
ncbi:transcription initiation factor-like protein subunit [Protomyces lactucae-debilis]|uniref:Transcription initiation factor-like protein subunit n=1 Tax=Protomyces lactucae-debilis TaxID=2754530 RepID=A0A1Y2FQF7_PROLT|nr:transcription initiation factor-like protein subunit [Protomyces lactucae-debilis]ORY86231.1 transcription initiation factor-like protein subunit [Protomyces lactucae-debilis]